jgi:hypothetical protein
MKRRLFNSALIPAARRATLACGTAILFGLSFASPSLADEDDAMPASMTHQDEAASGEVGSTERGINTQALLPSRLGPMESLLWSEHGFMRRAFDFPLTPDAREKELKVRRSMLTLHQVGGYLTFASMVTTCVLGQMIINGDESLEDAKGAAAGATIAMYFATAALSIFTPPPLVRRDAWSTTSTHKLLGIFHFAGMVITPIIAPEMGDSKQQRTFHQISGYATTALFGAALLTMTF